VHCFGKLSAGILYFLALQLVFDHREWKMFRLIFGVLFFGTVFGHPRPEFKGEIFSHKNPGFIQILPAFPEAPLDGEKPEINDHYMHADWDIETDFFKKNAKLVSGKANEAELENEYWLNNAMDFVEQQLKKKVNENIAKNIIFFLGDGMSIPTIASTRVYIGGEEKSLSFEKFPFTAMSRTYCVDKQVADSACTATAYLTGVS
jgi:hypothetical protein